MRYACVVGLLALGAWGVLLIVPAQARAAQRLPGRAPTVVELHDGRNSVTDHAFVLEDATGKLGLRDVRDTYGDAFQPLAIIGDGPGHSSSAYWLRFRVRNATTASSFIVELSMTPELAELYDAEAPPQRSGMALRFGERGVAHARIAFRITLPPGDETILWLRQRTSDRLWLAPAVWSEGAFWESRSAERMLHGICYGALLGLALYNLFLFLATRDRSYLLYVLFQITNGLTLATLDRYTFQYLWPDHPGWAARSVAVLEFLGLAAGVAFARAFLDTSRVAPRLDRPLRGLWVAAIALAGIWSVADPDVLALVAPRAMHAFIVALEMVGCVHALTAAIAVAAAGVIAAAQPGAINARVFVIAWAVLLAGTIAAALTTAGVVSVDGFQLLRLGAPIEAVLMSLALASRLNRLTREREHAQQELLAANASRVEALRQLVSGVAHEIGNPLNFAAGGADELDAQLRALEHAQPVAAAPARRAHHLVASGLDRIKAILDNLRRYLSVGDAEAIATDLAQEITRALELSAARLAAAGIRVESQISRLPVLCARPGELHQVLLNLIGNAIEAMPEGGTLRVVARPGESGVELAIADTGPGVAAAHREQIFEPFFTTRRSSGGTGLGLAVTREIVMRHGGTIRVESSDGGGARFVVSLPRPHAAASRG